MWGRWIINQVALLCILITGQNISAQDLINNNIHSGKTGDTAGTRNTTSRFHVRYTLDYSFSLTSSWFSNSSQTTNHNSIALFHSFKFLVQLDNSRNFKLTNQLVHNLGLQHFADSITLFQPDDNTLNTRFEYRLMTHFSFLATSVLTTRLMNGYDYSLNDSGLLVRMLNSSFLTPLTGIFSLGMGISIPSWGMLNIGISSGKLTYIYNTKIFETRVIENFYGVPKNKCLMFEYGLSFQLLIDKDVLKRVHMDCDFLFFKNYNAPVDITLKTLVGVKINRFLKTSILTKVLYEKMVSKNIQLENLVSIGFYFTL